MQIKVPVLFKMAILVHRTHCNCVWPRIDRIEMDFNLQKKKSGGDLGSFLVSLETDRSKRSPQAFV